MGQNWTQEDRDDWNRLNAMDEIDRSPGEEMTLRGLRAKRELVASRKQEVIRKSGPFYKASIYLGLAGVGSCLGGAAGGGSGLLGLGVVLVIVSALANGLNDRLSGGE